jgi:hypothetical protein
VGAYIAPLSSPDGADALLFVHHFFHNILRRGMASDSAWLVPEAMTKGVVLSCFMALAMSPLRRPIQMATNRTFLMHVAAPATAVYLIPPSRPLAHRRPSPRGGGSSRDVRPHIAAVSGVILRP